MDEYKQGDERKINKKRNEDKKEAGMWNEIKRVGVGGKV